MKKHVLAAAAAILTVAASTGAAAQSFQGPHVGAHAGWNHDKAKTAPWEYELRSDESKDALTGGIYLGYDHVVAPNVVVGVETGITAATKDRIVRSESGAVLEIDPKYSIDVSARAGYLIDPATLLYARGGYSNLRTKTSLAGKDGVLRRTDNLDGWMAGGGVERLLTSNVSGRLEYRFSKFSGEGSDIERHQVLIGAAYRF
jgi:outer membrane immunogenic protein